jgi:nucleoside-diphosphate-sugar epimerase
LPKLPPVDTLLCSVGWDRSSGQTIQQVYVEGLRNVLARLPAQVGRLLYVSSTGVYGQDDGQWVDEQTPCQPRRAGGWACLQAEQLLLASRWAERSVILRLAGIYGPGRLPRQRDLLEGRPLPADPTGTLNLIHVDDAVRAIDRAGALESFDLPRVYLISDGHPVRRGDFYDELARLLKLPPPSFAAGSSSRGRVNAHKRVSNQRMVRELGIEPVYATYRQGLAAIVTHE